MSRVYSILFTGNGLSDDSFIEVCELLDLKFFNRIYQQLSRGPTRIFYSGTFTFLDRNYNNIDSLVLSVAFDKVTSHA